MSLATKHQQLMAHPPKPRLTMTVGVTGHRLNKLAPKAIPDIEKVLKATFASIDRAVAAVARRDGGGGSGEPALYACESARLRLIVGAADGSDQMAVACRPAEWLAEAVLPFPRARYTEDFGPDKTFDGADRRADLASTLAACTSVVEWPESHGIDGRNRDPYEIAGTFLLRQVELLIAVWDGAEALGPGGTGALAARALQSGIPVIWIASTGDAPPRRLRDIADVREPWRLADATEVDIDACVEEMLAPAPLRDAAPAGGAPDLGAAEMIARFYAEEPRRRSRRIVYDFASRALTGKSWRFSIPLPAPDARPADWTGFVDTAGKADPVLARKIETILLPRYLWADALGIYYANAYRSAYLEGYLLSTLAIAVSLLAVFPSIMPENAPGIPVKLGLALFEIILITRVIFIVWRGQVGSWHERWLHYRSLAEHLRHLRFLSFIGAGTASQQGLDKGRGNGTGWLRWYLAATRRELGLPNGRLDADFQQPVLAAVEKFEIADQIAYHGPNSHNLRHLHHSLHRFGDGCFLLTLLILVVFFVAGVVLIVGRWLQLGDFWQALTFANVDMDRECAVGSSVCLLYDTKPYLTYFAALLPALGAAFAGMRFTGDFEGFAQRSQETLTTLQSLATTMSAAASQCDIVTTTRSLETLADAMAEDVSQWESLYSRKELALPA